MESPLPTTLEGLLLESQRLYAKVSDADFDDDADRDYTTRRATTALESLQRGVAREGVFSSNEEVEEIATQVLPLLAADYYLGSLLLKLPFTSPEIRLNVLKRVEVLLFKYLDTCEGLTLLEEDDRQAWQAMLKHGERSDSGGGQPLSRGQKIERYRRQKGIRQKMKEIEDDLEHAEVQGNEDESEADGKRRERSLLLLSSLGTDALDEVSGVGKETEMLKHLLAAGQQDEGIGQKGYDTKAIRDRDSANRSNGLEVTHISRIEGNLQIRKEDVRAAVFKPTVDLPTITVEEFGKIELERARQTQERNSDPSSTRRRYDQLEMDGEEDDEELVEKAAQHDRDWDDWKDEHPKGAGNKANKII